MNREAVRSLHERGYTRIRAAMLAEILWPGRRDSNANGQMFHLSAGVTGKMLRKCPAVWEVQPREWEIIPERLVS